MNWTQHFAKCTAHMSRSAVRELLKLTAQPGLISFAGGLPAAELFPVERVQQAVEDVLIRNGRSALQYSATEGLSELREWIAHRFSTSQLTLNRDNVAIVSGGQQGLDLIGRVLLEGGDKVVVENPTYLALLSAWRPLGVEFLPVVSDSGGMRLDQLENALSAKPKLIYTVPNFQNPQGTTLALERRYEIARLLPEHDVALIEDNPYGDLRYEGAPLPHLFALRPTHIIYVGTFSKVLMPGLRVGWVIAPEPVIDKLVQAKQAADLHTSTLSQYLVWELIRGNFLDEHVLLLREEYRARRDAMLNALERHLPPGVTWTRPEGGMFLMARLPNGVEGHEALRRALKQNVAFVPGAEFHLHGAGHNTIRLNFTQVAPPLIEDGIRRLARAIDFPVLSK